MTSASHKKTNVGVIGGSGYIGAELLRYLVTHPALDIRWVSANTQAGKRIDAVLPNLTGFLDLEYATLEAAEEQLSDVEAVMVCLPHNRSQEVIPRLAERAQTTVFIDMGGDFRSPDPARYEMFYGREHAASDWLPRFVYGLTELQREKLRKTRLVSSPGCFATAIDLALAPLASAGKLPPDVFIAATTGSSGAGNRPLPTTHHPERGTNMRAYKPLVHQHLLEIESFLSTLTEANFRLHFVPHSGPYVRGIFATVFTPGVGRRELEELLHSAYDGEALISVVSGSPDLRWTQGSPRAVLGIAGEDDRGVIFSTLDNLGKGGAGQGVQNLNCVLGLPETMGLQVPAGFV